MSRLFNIVFLCLLNHTYLLSQNLLKQDSFPAFFITDNGRDCFLAGYAENGMPLYDCTDNNLDAAKNTATSSLWPISGNTFNISGQNFSGLALFDGGLTRPTHREFSGRIILKDSNMSANSHATGVAGSLIAAGVDSQSRGHAYMANLNVWQMSNDVVKMSMAMPNILHSNHSYSSASGWVQSGGQWYWYGDTALSLTKDYRFGFYDTRARQWDSLMYANPNYVICKSAGNSRGSFRPPNSTHFYWNGSNWQLTNTTRDTIGPYDCIPTYGNAKNIITVGSNQFLNNQTISLSSQIDVLSFSGHGPTDDGRIKPDLVAPSGNIYTTTNTHDSAYGILGGTSISTPAVTASLHLLHQLHYQKFGQYIYNGLLKALAVNSCISCRPNGIGPSYGCGWGMPRFDIAAKHIKFTNDSFFALADVTLQNNDTLELFFYKAQNDTSKITVTWTDPPAVSSAPAFNDTTLKLINDIDMVVLNHAKLPVKYPFVLNPNQPDNLPTTGNNFRDNVEQCILFNDTTDFYLVRLTHKNTLTGFQQRIGLAASGILLQPTKRPVNLTFSLIQNQSMVVSFTKGNGQRRLVLCSTNPITVFPQQGVLYVVNDTFGLGSNIGNNVFVVYNDTGNQILVKNLQPNTNYNFMVVEYNGFSIQKPVYANNFALSGGNSTLPVVLNFFKGNQIENKIKLHWQTSSEQNNMGFDIMRSEDGNEFTKKGFVKGAGNSLILRNYEFEDVLNFSENNWPVVLYYYLNQVDFNGTKNQSKTISFKIEKHLEEKVFNIIPNPFNNKFNISFNRSIDKFTLTFSSMLGKEIFKKDFEKQMKGNVISFDDTDFLEPGIYFLIIQTNEDRFIAKILKF
ncbi:MAG: S8 family peptidase [Bacteroidia bacterium]